MTAAAVATAKVRNTSELIVMMIVAVERRRAYYPRSASPLGLPDLRSVLQQEVEEVRDWHLHQKPDPAAQWGAPQEGRRLYDLAALDDPARRGFARGDARQHLGRKRLLSTAHQHQLGIE